MSKQQQQIPALRFPEFEGEWIPRRISQILERYIDPVEVEQQKVYQEIGVRSHGKGIFHKTPLKGKKLGNKRVFWVHPFALVINIVFAWEQAVALTSEEEKGMIASHRFPMFLPKDNKSDLNLLRYFFLTKRGKHLLGLASPGGAGRNKTLGQGTFAKLKLPLPTLPEQRKIAAFLSAVDRRIDLQRQYLEQLRRYKQGAMQQIFSQEIRFQDENGGDFPAWEEKKLGEVGKRITRKNKENNSNVLTISAQQGLINQEEYFNKSVAAKDVSGYYLLHKGDFAYNKSYSNGYPLGAIKRLNNYEKGVVSTLYICFNISSGNDPRFFEQYFEAGRLNREIHKIAQEGARNHGLLNVSVVEFFKDIVVTLPSLPEQQKIAAILSSLDVKIDQAQEKLEDLEAFKKGLLQGMFV